MVPPVLRNLWTLVWFLYAGQVCCFNFDTRLPIIKRGAHGTYFGFSVAEHIITRDDPTPKIDNSVLLVGAPLDQNAQPQTNKSGALWRCPLSTLSFDCEQVITDGKRDAAGDYEWKIDNDHLRPPQKDEIKDGQWLGVTVRTQGQGGKVLVCAHRYIRTATDCTLDTCRWGRGLCYTLDNDLQLNDVVEPCKGRPMERGHEQYGYCQAGTSGLLLEDNAIIGAPGPYTWRGTVFVQSVSDEFLDRDQTMYYTPHIDDQSPVDKYSYLGMAVTAANFFGNGIAYAAGAPRADGTGQVILFNRKTSVITMTTRMVLSGDMYTSNFGYELATADVNGDRLPDLIVGAPNYFDKNQGGAIYVYLNSKNSCSLKCSQPLKITGQPESRFGISITNLGDINKDGFEDIAVGAPYEGHGAIYIYLGSKNGTIPEPSQIIRGEDYNIETFGYSLSGGTDLDFNGYPDLLVGAFDSSAAILFRTRPIIWITTNVGPQSALQKIDPASRSCANKDLACFKFQACVSIQSILEGGKLKAGSEGLTLNCTLHADITRPRLPRVFIENGSPQSKPSTVHSTITLEIDPDTLELRPYCHNHTVYIKDDTKDIQTAISMRLSYSIIQEPPKPLKPGSELPKMDHYPILNQQQADKVFQATFLKDCGENDICESQLNIDANLDLPFTRTKDNKDSSRYDLILGEYKEIQLNVTVHNLQESAYEAELHITHSPALSYIAAVKGRCERFPEKNLVICPLGNPLQRNKGVNVSLRFEPLREVDEVPDVNFTLTATTTSHLVDRQNDVVLVANVIRKADLKLRGSVRPEEVLYGGQVRGESEMKYKDQPGTRLRHTYEVVNDGPWHVNNLELHVEWPFQVANNKPLGKWLLYMDDEPAIEAEEGGVCDTSEGQVNPLHLWDRHSLTNPELTPNSTGPAQVASTSRRSRRDVEMIVKKGPDNIVHMNCRAKTAKCFKFRCIVYKLQKGQSATVTIKARLWNSTLVEDYPRVKAVHIASNAKLYIPTPSVTITSQPFDTQATAVTIAKGGGFAEQQASDGVELWMILVGVVAGLLLLLLIALLFWKCGFFKRTRPDPTLSGNLEKHTDDYHDY